MLAVAASLALVIRVDPADPPFQGLDDWWAGVADGSRASAWWWPAEFFNLLGSPIGLIVPIALAGFVFWYGRWRTAVFMGVCYIAVQAVNSGLKAFADRPRPEDGLVAVHGASFPSGHSARMAVLVFVIGMFLVPLARRRRWWAIGAVLAAAMMWARTWQHAHWLTDVAGGACVGLGVALLLWFALSPWVLRDEAPSGRHSRPDDTMRIPRITA